MAIVCIRLVAWVKRIMNMRHTRKRVTRKKPNEASMGKADGRTLISRASKGLCTDKDGVEVTRVSSRVCLVHGVDGLSSVRVVVQPVDKTPGETSHGE